SPEDDAEVRRISLTNTTDYVREIEVTSYAEVVIAPPAADAAHTTFSNLFVETEFIPERGALLATRRPRSATQPRVWAVHVVTAESPGSEVRSPESPDPTSDPGLRTSDLQYETDRARFIGRGRTPADPAAMEENAALSNSAGA